MRVPIIAGCAALALGGCATPFVDVEERASWSTQGTTPLTAPIGILADTQFHESRGVPSRSIGRAGDEFIAVTVRTGQQVIGAGDMLRHALELTQQFPLVLHAGDALDVSCETEWWLFKIVTTRLRGQPGPRSWLFAPGNHDGYHTGNIFPVNTSAYVESYWTNMCNAGRLWKKDWSGKSVQKYSHMPKDRIVSEYLKMLEPLKARGDAQNGCDADGSLCWSARVSRNEQWTSFVVQRVRLPAPIDSVVPIYAVLLDSSDYSMRPDVTRISGYAGRVAAISARQLHAAYELVNHLPSQARYFFVTHHPVSDWRISTWPEETRGAWNRLLEDPRSLRFLVSAHTHEGSLRRYEEGVGILTELNIGSLADAPVYIRSLWFEMDGSGNIGFRSSGIPLRSENVCPEGWARKSENKDKSLDYSVDEQRSESDRASEWPTPLRNLRAFFSAGGHFFNYWKAKHEELRPQLLAYADVVEATMPRIANIKYVGSTTDGPDIELALLGGGEVAKALRTLATCKPDETIAGNTGARFCTVQSKANLLRKLDEYYWEEENVSQEVKERAHRLRLCLALAAAEESPSKREKSKINDLLHRVKSEWSSQLYPLPSAH